MNDFNNLALKRESCRSFDPTRTVSADVIRECLDAARNAPSACNSQPWSFKVVMSKEKLPGVLECIQEDGANPFASDAAAIVVVCEEAAVLMSSNGFVKSQKYAWADVGQAVAYFTLSACSHGLSTCILGRINDSRLHEILSLSEQSVVRLAIAVGYASDSAVREKKRKSLERVAEFV